MYALDMKRVTDTQHFIANTVDKSYDKLVVQKLDRTAQHSFETLSQEYKLERTIETH